MKQLLVFLFLFSGFISSSSVSVGQKTKQEIQQLPLIQKVYTTDHTLTAADIGAWIVANFASDGTITIPANATVAIPVGTALSFYSEGAGYVELEAAATVTFIGDAGIPAGGFVTALKRSTNTWIIIGGEAVVAYDADAQDFFDRVVVAGDDVGADKAAWNSCVVGLKADGNFSTMIASWVYLGSLDAGRKINAGSAAHDQTWTGVSFISGSGGGVRGNGTTGYINTNLNPSTAISSTTAMTMFWWITETAAADCYDMGGKVSGTSGMTAVTRYSSGGAIGYYQMLEGGGSAGLAPSIGDASGFWMLTRTANNSLKLYRNGTLVDASTYTETGTSLPNLNLFIAAYNNSGSASDFSGRTYKLNGVMDRGCDATQAANIYSRFNTFLTAIGR